MVLRLRRIDHVGKLRLYGQFFATLLPNVIDPSMWRYLESFANKAQQKTKINIDNIDRLSCSDPRYVIQPRALSHVPACLVSTPYSARPCKTSGSRCRTNNLKQLGERV